MNINRRLEAMRERLECVKLAREMEPDPDALSLSLFEFGRELAGLDTLGTSALVYELNHGDPLEGTMGLNLTMDDVDRLVEGMRV